MQVSISKLVIKRAEFPPKMGDPARNEIWIFGRQAWAGSPIRSAIATIIVEIATVLGLRGAAGEGDETAECRVLFEFEHCAGGGEKITHDAVFLA